MEDAEEQETSEKETPVPKNKTKRNSRKPASNAVKEDSEEEPTAHKRGTANGKGATAKKTKAPTSKVKAEEHDIDSEEGFEDLPTAKKGRKKAPASMTAKSRAKKAGTEAV